MFGRKREKETKEPDFETVNLVVGYLQYVIDVKPVREEVKCA
jgi:hypothetical protein